MFKKRSRPASVRQKDSPSVPPTEDVGPSGSNTPDPSNSNHDAPNRTEEDDPEIGADIDELIMLRKLRKSKQGIDLAKLNRGEDRKIIVGASERYGIQSQKKQGGEDDWVANEAERIKRLVRSNNFTQQTNALDVDKHMLAYIEAEFQKRRGQANQSTSTNEKYDPEAEIYRIAEKFKLETPRNPDAEEEGNVTNSMGMLTSIPEIDLGMDNRLRNIEATERAKRDMMEMRKLDAQRRRKPEDIDFAAARYHLPNLRVASDVYAMDAEKREAAGLPPPMIPRGDRSHQQATDAEVFDRFKKRAKR